MKPIPRTYDTVTYDCKTYKVFKTRNEIRKYAKTVDSMAHEWVYDQAENCYLVLGVRMSFLIDDESDTRLLRKFLYEIIKNYLPPHFSLSDLDNGMLTDKAENWLLEYKSPTIESIIKLLNIQIIMEQEG